MLAFVALLVLTASVYLPVIRFGFLSLDDPTYVVDNAYVRAGLTPSTLAWALRSVDGANWHPLTWLSHALDVQIFGLSAGGHHATNLALHLLAVALVFLALRSLTGAHWRSLAVAALFALHPLNVESVAWIAERKNLLSAVFYAATLLAYSGYARHPTLLRYAWVTILYALGLMTKPMLVTLPCVLLLLDVWPLDRWRTEVRGRLIAEKLPWLALSAASIAVTVLAQSRGGTVVTWQDLGLGPRICTATAGYAEYVRLLVWPMRLAVYVPGARDPCQELPVVTASSSLLIISLGLAWLARTRLAAAIGWLWFVGMLVPVSGLMQVGSQRIADRYVYHPIVGFGVALLFGIADRVPPHWARAVGLAFVLACVAWAWRTRVELGYWQSNERLFARAIEVTGRNCMAETQLGVALRARGDVPGAIQRWEEALRQCPDWGEAHSHLGTALANRGDLDAAMPHFARAAESPDIAAAMRYNLGLALWLKGRREDARREVQAALAADPKHEPALELLRRIETAP
jgi:tetratricopeptide (TPR) repeat protein